MKGKGKDKDKKALVFNSRISKMGDNKIIWIPLALHEMTGDYEDKKVRVTVEAVTDEVITDD